MQCAPTGWAHAVLGPSRSHSLGTHGLSSLNGWTNVTIKGLKKVEVFCGPVGGFTKNL
jgi:hypothetical protein